MFEVEAFEGRWTISDGVVRFGPYATQARAERSIAALNALRAFQALSPADRLERLLAERP